MIFESLEKEYEKQEKEIFVLINDDDDSALKTDTCWIAQTYFLAYIDLRTNELKNGKGRLIWPITEDTLKNRSFFNRFKKGIIYRISARELIDKSVTDGMIPSFFNRFLLVDVLEEDVQNDELLAILAEYRKPVVFIDEVMGEFQLNKDRAEFDGSINWLEKEISVSLEVTVDNKGSWTKARKTLRHLYDEQKRFDSEFRAFAANKLTSLANDWIQEKNAESIEISQQDFINKISLSELTVTSSGNFKAYYDDDNMFLRHAIVVYGSIKKGLKTADIED